MVYEDAEKLYAEVKKDGEQLEEEALVALFPSSVRSNHGTSAENIDSPGTVFAFNPTFFPRLEIVHVPFFEKRGTLRESVVFQNAADGKGGLLLMAAEANEPCARPSIDVSRCLTPSGTLLFSGGVERRTHRRSAISNGPDHAVLGNARVRLTISNGRIASLYDIAQE